jgi:hypothetical protein
MGNVAEALRKELLLALPCAEKVPISIIQNV